VMPQMTSVLTVVEFSRSLNKRSIIAGVSGALAVRAARAAMLSLLRHAHTDVRRSGSRSLEARVLPRAAGSIPRTGFEARSLGCATSVTALSSGNAERTDRPGPRILAGCLGVG